MSLIESLNDVAPAIGGVLSIGNFDGVHRGHQQMIAKLVELAAENSAPAVVLTFNPHPIRLLAPEKVPPSLSTLQRKSELLHSFGVDHVVAVPTTAQLLSLTATEFFDTVVRDSLNAVGMVEGPNFHFGKNRGGDVEFLSELCDKHGMSCSILEPVSCGSAPDSMMISSSVVRSAISDGRLTEAVALLGRPYQIRGRVVHGDGRGRSLGYPTANLTDVETLLPPDGVYAGWSDVDGKVFPAAINIGGNPTFDEHERKIEVHLIGYQGDAYNAHLHVNLLAEIRGVMKFDSVETLTNQIKTDVAKAVRIANSSAHTSN